MDKRNSIFYTFRLTEAASTEDENGKQKFDFSKRIPIDSNDINDLIQASQRVTVPEWLIPELEKVKVCGKFEYIRL